MSIAGTAWERLEAAVVRLEAAARTAAEDAGARDPESSRRDLEALRAERDGLHRALAEARTDRDDLQRVTDRVAGRLDLAISQLKTLLER